MAKNDVKTKIVGIDQLTPDDKNFNLGTQYGQHLIEQSISRFGAGRSILIDKNGRVIAGNKTLENAGALGLNEVIIVQTDGKKLVAVQRTDVDLDTKQGREMALADNVTSEKNLEYDFELLDQVAKEMGIDEKDWGLNVNIDDSELLDDQGDNEGNNGKSNVCKLIVECNSEEERDKLRLKLEAKGYICKDELH